MESIKMITRTMAQKVTGMAAGCGSQTHDQNAAQVIDAQLISPWREISASASGFRVA
jgi:hypothetical protein